MAAALQHWYHAQAARWALRLGRRERAIAHFEQVLALTPGDAPTLASLAFVHAEAGDSGPAIALLERLLQVTPEDADAWFNLGFLQQQQTLHEAAIASFGRTVAVNDRHDRAWYGLALSLVDLGRLPEAVAPLRRNCMLQPLSPHGFVQLARVLLALGERDACRQAMVELGRFDPRAAAALEDETGIDIGVDRWWRRAG